MKQTNFLVGLSFLSLVVCVGPVRGMADPPAEAAAFDVAALIKPVLVESCLDCHGPAAQLGGLRVDTREALLEGGVSGPSIVPEKPEESSFYVRVTLPADDFQMMPLGADPLPEEVQQQIRRWIELGAPWPDGMQIGDPPEPEADDAAGVESPESEAVALRQLTDAGAIAMRIARNTAWIRVDFSLNPDAFQEQHLELLAHMPNLYELNLANTAITDAGLQSLQSASNLRRLYLQNTGITDAALESLAGLQHLRYLNLYGTSVSDAGLVHLQQLAALERLFLWQTAVTEQGADTLRQAVPEVDINLGL